MPKMSVTGPCGLHAGCVQFLLQSPRIAPWITRQQCGSWLRLARHSFLWGSFVGYTLPWPQMSKDTQCHLAAAAPRVLILAFDVSNVHILSVPLPTHSMFSFRSSCFSADFPRQPARISTSKLRWMNQKRLFEGAWRWDYKQADVWRNANYHKHCYLQTFNASNLYINTSN